MSNNSAPPAARSRVNRIPSSTYRLQLGANLRLADVRRLLPYLHDLGISDVYLSPLFRARSESSHGYDVVDHGAIDPAIGTIDDFEQLADAARKLGMGILLDVVPNHMGINDPGNVWWLDVLENGQASPYADYFDIEWEPPAKHLRRKVLLPFLGDPFGEVLERGDLRVAYQRQRFHLSYGDREFPLTPCSWPSLLKLVLEIRGGEDGQDAVAASGDYGELQSIVLQLERLPPFDPAEPASRDLRLNEQSIARRRLHELLERSPATRQALDEALVRINGRPGEPRSFDQLEQLLDRQWYRLAHWRVASDEINYRRFFDINDLAAVRVEDPRVFDSVHRLVGRFLEEEWVTGLRIDHPDGLFDPAAYFESLHALYRRSRREAPENAADEIYVLAEKILSGDEELLTDWRVSGTTGYDFMNVVNRLLVDGAGLLELRQVYPDLTGASLKAADVVYESKRAVLRNAMASELHMLAVQLHRCAQQHRSARDFTLPSLQSALREIIACMSVYRTYLRPHDWDVAEADYRRIATAVRMAKRRNQSVPFSIFDFIASVLLQEHPPGLDKELAIARRQFSLRMQQVTGPVTAKGIEDTAFYRYYPLASLNEVGGELDAPPLASEEFHRLMQHRAALWPHALSATATHDTKRGEDMRARLSVLSEVPGRWFALVRKWRCICVEPSGADDTPEGIDPNDAYLLLQTLVGTWPLALMDDAAQQRYIDRINGYMQKALREAKVHTSWTNPSADYEAAVQQYAHNVIQGDCCEEFRSELEALVRDISRAGFVNSLSQALLKMTLPGVPDFYQGTELWDFNLVDPDNRRPVDFAQRQKLLESVKASFDERPGHPADALSSADADPRIKLHIIWRTLHVRQADADLFAEGEYVALETVGRYADRVVAFARRRDARWAVVAAPLRVLGIRGETPDEAPWSIDWDDTAIVLPAEAPAEWRHEFTAATLAWAQQVNAGRTLAARDFFSSIPVALLTSTTA